MAKNIFRASALLLIINIIVKLLGMGREMAIAATFGVNATTDAYWAAFTFPYLLQTVLGYAFVSAILPMMSEYWRERGDNGLAYRLGSTMINVVGIGMLVLSLLGMLIAPALIWITAPGLDAATTALAEQLTRIIFPSIMFMSMGMVISAILNSRYRFGAAAIAPGISSLVIIIAALIFARGNIYILAIGTLVSYIFFLAVQMLDLPKTGFKYQFSFDIRHSAIRRALKNIAPIILGLAVNQIYTIISRNFASGIAEGTITTLNYASKLMNVPLGVFVAAIITVAFPFLAEKAQLADKTQLIETTKRGLSMILLVAIPSAIGLMLLDTEIIAVVFERGAFSATDTITTAQALFALAPGLIFLAISMLLIRVYYALHDVKTPLITGAISIVVNIIFSFILVGPLAHTGLCLANSLAALTNAALMVFFLHRRFHILAGSYMKKLLLQVGLASAAMAGVVLLGKALWPTVSGTLALLVELAVLVVVAVAVFALILKLLHCQVLEEMVRGMRKKG